LRSGETALGPAVGGTVDVEEGVLLLKTVPGSLILALVEDLHGMVTVVGPVGGAVVVVGLAEDEDVVASTEGILEDACRTKVDIGVVTRGLVGRGTVEVPDAEGTDVGNLLAHSGGLGAKSTITVNPDVCKIASVSRSQRLCTEDTYTRPGSSHPGGEQGRARGDRSCRRWWTLRKERNWGSEEEYAANLYAVGRH